MPPAVEIVILQTSEAYRKDPSIINPLADHVKEAGAIGFYSGFTEENANEAYLVIVWKTLEDHYALMNDKVVYPKMGAIIGTCIVEPPVMFHVHFEPEASLAPALNAPVTSLAQITSLKPGQTSDDLVAVLNDSVSLSGPDGLHKSTGLVFGKLVERDEYVLVNGWNGPEEHLAFGKSEGKVAENIKKLVAVTGDRKVVHLKLSSYLKYEG